MKWYEKPQEITDYWNENSGIIKGYEKHFDWANKKINYIVLFHDKSIKKEFEYSFDGIKP